MAVEMIDVPALIFRLRRFLSLNPRRPVTQAELAQRLGVSFSTINRWEGGHNLPQRAQLDRILALARQAGVPSEEYMRTVEQSTSVQEARKAVGRTVASVDQAIQHHPLDGDDQDGEITITFTDGSRLIVVGYWCNDDTAGTEAIFNDGR